MPSGFVVSKSYLTGFLFYQIISVVLSKNSATHGLKVSRWSFLHDYDHLDILIFQMKF